MSTQGAAGNPRDFDSTDVGSGCAPYQAALPVGANLPLHVVLFRALRV
jgi:hypothetical protein